MSLGPGLANTTESTVLLCPNPGCSRPIGNQGNLTAHRRRCDAQTPEQRTTDRERIAAGLKVASGYRKRVAAWERLERRPPLVIDGAAWLARGPVRFADEAREMRRELVARHGTTEVG